MIDRKPPSNYRRTALIVACALFMQNLDATILATALPTMAREFAVPPPEMSLALTGYLLALAIFIPASGPIADRFGARRTFQGAIATFVLGSLACGFSPNLTVLVAARFVQGVGGAMMVPVGRLVLLRSVEKHEMVAAMAWLTMPAMIGPILGPPVGGLIVTWLNWRWIFWINFPVGICGVVLVGKYIADFRASTVPAFDAKGFFISASALGPLIFGIELVARSGRAELAWCLIIFGLLAAVLYVRHALSSPAPLLDVSLMRIATFRYSLIGGGLIRLVQGAVPFLMPMLLQLAYGINAAKSGGVTAATAIGAFFMKGVARTLLTRFGFRTILTVIGMLAPISYAILGFIRNDWPMAAIFLILLICGFLISLQFTSYNAIAYADVESERMSRATSFYATFQQLTLSIGICAGASALAVAMRWHGHTEPHFEDFSIAIWTIAAISLLATWSNVSFSRDAGNELSGHRPRW